MPTVSVVDGFTYALDSQGEITRVTYQDGAYWNYAYDGRKGHYDFRSGGREDPEAGEGGSGGWHQRRSGIPCSLCNAGVGMRIGHRGDVNRF